MENAGLPQLWHFRPLPKLFAYGQDSLVESEISLDLSLLLAHPKD